MIASSVAPSTNVAPPTVGGDDASLRIPSEHQEKAAPESAIPWNKGRLIGQKAPFKHQECSRRVEIEYREGVVPIQN